MPSAFGSILTLGVHAWGQQTSDEIQAAYNASLKSLLDTCHDGATVDLGHSCCRSVSDIVESVVKCLPQRVLSCTLKAISPGAIARPAPMDSNAPRPR